MQSLCNLRHFRDKFLTEPLAWIPSAENICIAQQLYEIFISWEKNDYHLEDVVLTYMKTLLCRVDCTLFSEKVYTRIILSNKKLFSTIYIGLVLFHFMEGNTLIVHIRITCFLLFVPYGC
jgi:hypothetical protein